MTTKSDEIIEDIFKRVLTSVWLRPERALMEAHLFGMARKFLGDKLGQPSLEYGCTDGVPTFVMMGGSFQMQFDDYIDITCERNNYKMNGNVGRDYFDHVSGESVSTEIIAARPSECFTTGISWKEAHILKARRLDFYKELHRAEFGATLDFLRLKYYRTIWSPNLYWLEDAQLDAVVKDLRRAVAMDGRLVTFFPNERQLEHSFYPQMLSVDEGWAKDIDRGIHGNFTRHVKSCEYWRDYFAARGWFMVRHESFLPAVVLQVYQIGLRPMFPVFMNMYQRLRQVSPEGLLDLKEHWIECVEHFLLPMCRRDWMAQMGHPDLWNMYEFRPME